MPHAPPSPHARLPVTPPLGTSVTREWTPVHSDVRATLGVIPSAGLDKCIMTRTRHVSHRVASLPEHPPPCNPWQPPSVYYAQGFALFGFCDCFRPREKHSTVTNRRGEAVLTLPAAARSWEGVGTWGDEGDASFAGRSRRGGQRCPA